MGLKLMAEFAPAMTQASALRLVMMLLLQQDAHTSSHSVLPRQVLMESVSFCLALQAFAGRVPVATLQSLSACCSETRNCNAASSVSNLKLALAILLMMCQTQLPDHRNHHAATLAAQYIAGPVIKKIQAQVTKYARLL